MVWARLITWRPEPCPSVPMTCSIFSRAVGRGCLPPPLAHEGSLARCVIEERKVTPVFWAVLLVRAAILVACTHRTAESYIGKNGLWRPWRNDPDAPNLLGWISTLGSARVLKYYYLCSCRTWEQTESHGD